jgi:hypothetical protein
MNTKILVRVVAVKEGDTCLNFNFVPNGSIDESWCLGSLKIDPSIHLRVNDEVILVGEWQSDFYGRRVNFFAEHVGIISRKDGCTA